MRFFSEKLDKIKDPYKVNAVGIHFLEGDNYAVVAHTDKGVKVRLTEPINTYFREPEFVIDEFDTMVSDFYMSKFEVIPYTSMGSNNFCVNIDNFRCFTFTECRDKKPKMTNVEAVFDDCRYVVVDSIRKMEFQERWKDYYKNLEKIIKAKKSGTININRYNRTQRGE